MLALPKLLSKSQFILQASEPFMSQTYGFVNLLECFQTHDRSVEVVNRVFDLDEFDVQALGQDSDVLGPFGVQQLDCFDLGFGLHLLLGRLPRHHRPRKQIGELRDIVQLNLIHTRPDRLLV